MEDINQISNPFDFRSWWHSIQAIPTSQYIQRAALFQKALSYLPGSFKLWFNFLTETKAFAAQFKLSQGDDSHHKVVLDLYEASLKYMFNMPRIWLDYAEFSGSCQLIGHTRTIYDRAL